MVLETWFEAIPSIGIKLLYICASSSTVTESIESRLCDNCLRIENKYQITIVFIHVLQF